MRVKVFNSNESTTGAPQISKKKKRKEKEERERMQGNNKVYSGEKGQVLSVNVHQVGKVDAGRVDGVLIDEVALHVAPPHLLKAQRADGRPKPARLDVLPGK